MIYRFACLLHIMLKICSVKRIISLKIDIQQLFSINGNVFENFRAALNIGKNLYAKIDFKKSTTIEITIPSIIFRIYYLSQFLLIS